jgi:hypothetical protein
MILLMNVSLGQQSVYSGVCVSSRGVNQDRLEGSYGFNSEPAGTLVSRATVSDSGLLGDVPKAALDRRISILRLMGSVVGVMAGPKVERLTSPIMVAGAFLRSRRALSEDKYLPAPPIKAAPGGPRIARGRIVKE